MKRLACPALAVVLGATAALVPMSAEAAPRSSIIAFISDRDTPPGAAEPQDEVYVYDTRSGTTSRITNDPDAENLPVVSPDGRYLAYLRFDGVEFCRLVRAGDGWTCTVTRFIAPQPALASPYEWTPDGKSLVYSARRAGESDSDIWRLDLAGVAAARNLTDEAPGDPELSDFQPTVSPDGRWLVFTRDGDLWRSRLDGSHLVQLTSTPAPVTEFGAEVSPDGKRLAFHSNRRTPGDQATSDLDVYVMKFRPESANNVPLDVTPGLTAQGGGPSRERFPSFSPDGERIAFWWSVGGGQSDLDTGEIYTVRADGTDPVNLTDNNPTSPAVPSVGDIFPDWGRARR